MLENITKSASRFAHKATTVVKDYSPEILVATAIVSGAAAIYLACKATHDDLDDILTEAEDKMNWIIDEEETKQIAPSDAKKEKLQVKINTATKLAKAYAPAAICATISASSTLGANHILSKRNAALVASYAALDRYVKGYQQRVLNEVGEEVERRIRYDIHDDEYVENSTDEETGETKETVKVKEDVVHDLGRYAVVFDEKSSRFQNNADYDETFLHAVQEEWNKYLECRRTNKKPGKVYLDEVLYDLDIEPEDLGLTDEAAHILGWYLPPKDESNAGANDIHHINFGLGYWFDRAKRDMNRDQYGYDGILVEFNIDGVVCNL